MTRAPGQVDDARKVAGLRRELWLPTAWNRFPKAGGKKGLHLYLPIAEASDQRTSGCRPASREVHKDLVVSRMDKRLLTGKVFVDWSQNRQAGAKPDDGLSGPARTSHRRQASASRVSPLRSSAQQRGEERGGVEAAGTASGWNRRGRPARRSARRRSAHRPRCATPPNPA